MSGDAQYFRAASFAAIVQRIEARLVDCRLSNVVRREHDWVFSFDNDVTISVYTSWRIVSEGRNRLGDCDDGQQFGVPAPVAGEQAAAELLQNKSIRQLTIREDTGDLCISVDGAILEIIHISSGYEGWHLDAGSLEVIAQGGGQLAIWER